MALHIGSSDVVKQEVMLIVFMEWNGWDRDIKMQHEDTVYILLYPEGITLKWCLPSTVYIRIMWVVLFNNGFFWYSNTFSHTKWSDSVSDWRLQTVVLWSCHTVLFCRQASMFWNMLPPPSELTLKMETMYSYKSLYACTRYIVSHPKRRNAQSLLWRPKNLLYWVLSCSVP